jgi:hypothetical protein
MEKDKKEAREILPANGIWSVEDFARYMGLRPGAVQQALTQMGVKTFGFSRLYRHRFFRLEDLKRFEIRGE